MDKTPPVISVSYDNNDAVNGNYFAAERTAAVSINERNFETSRIRITGTANDNGVDTVFPEVSSWRSNGDVHTATIYYSEDSKYTFTIEYTDKAGNMAEEYPIDEFYIDKTSPTLEISGVSHKSANNGEVAPVVTYSDTNIDIDNVSITLSGANRGPVSCIGEYMDIENGRSFVFEDFARTKDVDDIYTLDVKITDLAGNETSETIMFSVNRFGSVYVLHDSLKAIEGKYIRDEIDVIVTEINVDSLKHDSINIKLTKNDMTTDLTEGTDYIINKTGGDGEWSEYEYVIHKSLFAGDGKYNVTLYSEDAAGNINENIDESKKAEISFGVDKTEPIIVPIDFEDGKTYAVESKTVTVSIYDNLVLEDAIILLNDKPVEYEVDGDDYTFEITSSNSPQKVKITATDAAGNQLVKEVKDFYVTTNLFIRWYTNKPLFVGSLSGVGLVLGGIAVSIILSKKKKTVEA